MESTQDPRAFTTNDLTLINKIIDGGMKRGVFGADELGELSVFSTRMRQLLEAGLKEEAEAHTSEEASDEKKSA
jgi:hypothetical protein|uniref:Uncharacterized protein n=1 Tax=viral metagenome TaxID=1070528 RepID=A0A6C0IUW6_9ZZZZ